MNKEFIFNYNNKTYKSIVAITRSTIDPTHVDFLVTLNGNNFIIQRYIQDGKECFTFSIEDELLQELAKKIKTAPLFPFFGLEFGHNKHL